LSALKHGFFRHGFMLCDRCALNGCCGRFRAGGRCAVEEEAFDRLVEELTGEYGLDGVADRMLADRVAMTLIRVARVEAYEAYVGVSEETVVLGGYIDRLDRMLLRLLEALAVTREKRRELEGGEALTVAVTDLLKGLKKRSKRARPRRAGEISVWTLYDEMLEGLLRDLEDPEGKGCGV